MTSEILAEEDLTPLLWGVLVSVLEEPGRTQRHLARRMGIDPVSFGQMIDMASGLDAALTDKLLIYANERGPGLGEACDIPQAIGQAIDRLRDKDAGAPLAPWLDSRIGIRRKNAKA